LKLVHALDHFQIDPMGAVCLDLGASTGGFTDVLLARGAALVHAVDVGHDQMASRLRADPRVRSHERVNARDLGRDLIPDAIGLITCDVSFIGLELALPPALALAAPGALLVTLIKPQFEVGAGRVGKGGLVRDPALRAAVCQRLTHWLAAQPGWSLLGLTDSPIEGGDGNVEFLLAGRFAA
jgi:23S rRNA (cytidine1920-2'-O)/16S rRNA (cytidine1409-2'-O)-methyltransferase